MAPRQEDCSLNVSADFALSQMMSLGQFGNTQPSSYTFDCKLDALQQSSLTLIVLHDLTPNFGNFSFCFDQNRVPS